VAEAAAGDLTDVLAVECAHFPAWLGGLEQASGAGAPRSAVFTRAATTAP